MICFIEAEDSNREFPLPKTGKFCQTYRLMTRILAWLVPGDDFSADLLKPFGLISDPVNAFRRFVYAGPRSVWALQILTIRTRTDSSSTSRTPKI